MRDFDGASRRLPKLDVFGPKSIAGRKQSERGGRPEGLSRAEPERRASIARRYVALARPTEADDLAYAEKLSLSVDSQLRLAAAWWKGQDPDKTRFTYRNPPEEVRQAASAAAVDPDLSGVDPVRRAKTSRRIAVVRRFHATRHPGPDDLDAAARELGMNRTSAEAGRKRSSKSSTDPDLRRPGPCARRSG